MEEGMKKQWCIDLVAQMLVVAVSRVGPLALSLGERVQKMITGVLGSLGFRFKVFMIRSNFTFLDKIYIRLALMIFQE